MNKIKIMKTYYLIAQIVMVIMAFVATGLSILGIIHKFTAIICAFMSISGGFSFYIDSKSLQSKKGGM